MPSGGWAQDRPWELPHESAKDRLKGQSLARCWDTQHARVPGKAHRRSRLLIHSGLAERAERPGRWSATAVCAQIQGADTDRGRRRGTAYLSCPSPWRGPAGCPRILPGRQAHRHPARTTVQLGEAGFRATGRDGTMTLCQRPQAPLPQLSLSWDRCGHAAEARHGPPHPSPLGR